MRFLFSSTLKKLFRKDAPTPDQQRLDRMAMKLGLSVEQETTQPKGISLSWAVSTAAVAVIALSVVMFDGYSNTGVSDNGGAIVLQHSNESALNNAIDGSAEGESLLALVDETDLENILANLTGDSVASAVDEWGTILPKRDE